MNRLMIALLFLSLPLAKPETLESDLPYRNSASSTQAYCGGEFLEYDISFGFYTAAYASLSVSDTIRKGIKIHHVRAFAETRGIMKYLFPIRDTYESFIDKKSNLPVFSIRDINEGRYKHYNEVSYNRNDSTALSLKTGLHNIPSKIQDILSLFYFARRFDFNDDLRIGQRLTYNAFFCDKLFEIILQYRGIESVTTKVGELNCYKFTLCERNGDKIEVLENMNFWITRDGNRIPARIEFEIVIGSFVVDLANYSGLNNPVLSKM